MSIHVKRQQISEGLYQLEQTLRVSQLWSSVKPSIQALSSTEPFACDTLSFEQWLQFIFIPKMRVLIENEDPLPLAMAITPMAEMSFGALHSNVTQCLRALDEVISK